MKITVPVLKPRNPLVAPARMRRAGLHLPAVEASRQQAHTQLRRELEQLDRPRQSP